MVKSKPQKSKPKKQPQAKKNGKQTDMVRFRAHLDSLGLKIIEITADGNCFFRALADQLEGNEEHHQKYRSMVVQYIEKNRETFEPFIEDDVPFNEYCQSMEEDGMWAGNMELQAASLVTHCNICIHRYMSPRWYIRNFNDQEARMVHLSYHDGEHYNSLRLKEDPCNGPALPVIIKADADISAASNQAKTAASKSNWAANLINEGSIKMVMAGTGCENTRKVEEVLLQVGGDVDAAVEFLVAEQAAEIYSGINNDADTSHGDNKNGNCEQHKEEPIMKTCKQDKSNNSIKRSHDDSGYKPNEKIPRNKVCPCGSKKKFKACCGSATGIPSTSNQTVDSRKGRKDRKQSKKGGPANTVSSCGSDGGPPDMGALCI
ncbi:OTU domain-containing protein 3 [Melia azedarach]|uniref:OTU domain-containing protein 3 n=1 Tax=Melia azedarach TaxID=155640 RepID=A0ACC1XV96_MELAZ|nr:OTU domain-containing protein 3 [Melia azedarach]